MDIKTKFNVGDKFIEIGATSYVGRETCSACSGRGYILLDNGDKLDCPECYSKGYKEIYGEKEWRVLSDEDHDFYSIPIGSIGIEITGQRPPKIKIRYIRKNTGNFVYEENCFSTVDEAQAECDKRNLTIKSA